MSLVGCYTYKRNQLMIFMKKVLIAASLFALPLVASAQALSNIPILISFAGDVLNRIIPVIIALTLVTFFWGLFKYVKGSQKDATQGKHIMIAGLLALFVMVSVWGIIRLMQNTLGVSTAPVNIPQVPQR